jgi:hypothetical protein
MKYIIILTLLLLNPVAYADGHCYDFPDDADCKETTEVVDLLDLFTGGSKTDSSKYPDGTLEVRNYSIFSDEGDHFKELVKQEKFLSASKLFNKYENDFFTVKAIFGGVLRTIKYKDEINAVSEYLLEANKKELSDAIFVVDSAVELTRSSNVSLANKWSVFSDIIQSIEKSKEYYNLHRVIKYQQESGITDRWNLSSPINIINKKKEELNSALKGIASKEFDRFDFSSGKDFFKDYPVKIYKSKVIASSSKTILGWLNSSSLDEAIALIDKYNLNRSVVRNKLAGILLDNAFRATDGDKQPALMDIVATLKQIKDLGVNIHNVEIPARYRAIFFQADKTSDFDNIRNILQKEEPYLILIDKRKLDVTKSDGRLEKIHSKYVSSRSMVSNPDYYEAQRDYDSAVNNYNNAVRNYEQQKAAKIQAQRDLKRQFLSYNCETSYSGSYASRSASTKCATEPEMDAYDYHAYSSALSGQNIARGLGQAFGRKTRLQAAADDVSSYNYDVNLAKTELDDTPRKVEKLNHTEYAFTTRTYDVIKTFEYVIYFINRVAKEYSVANVPLVTQQSFVVAGSLHPQDINYNLTTFQTLDDIDIFTLGLNDISDDELMDKVPAEHSLSKYSKLLTLLLDIKSSYVEPIIDTTQQPLPADDISKPTQEKKIDIDYITDLKRIKGLLDDGIINQDDFETLKQKIIDKL